MRGVALPNGLAVQLGATAPPWLGRSAEVSMPDSTKRRLEGAVARQPQPLVGPRAACGSLALVLPEGGLEPLGGKTS